MKLKAYVSNWNDHSDKRHRDLWFKSDPKSAKILDSEAEAGTHCRVFDKSGIAIPSNEGGAYVLRRFKVEKLAPNRFVIFCEGPFIQQSQRPGVIVDDAP
jgi:hypothetical protein